MRKKFITLLAILAALCGVAAAAAAPAMASTTATRSARPALVRPDASCYAGSCYNVDPELSGCADSATTVLAHDYKAENETSFALEIRYSSVCAAAWLRLTTWSGYNVSFAMSAWNPGGTSVGFSGALGEEKWTAMVPTAHGQQACVGTQFSVNGNWVRWYFLGCYTA